MKNWLASLFRPRQTEINHLPAGAAAAPAEPREGAADALALQHEQEAQVLRLEHEIQSLQLEISTRDEKIERLQQEVERLRYRQEQTVAEGMTSRLAALFADAAAPASQILTQAYLLEEQQKPVQARDVLAVARRITRALEQHGLVFDGQVGEQASFDPSRHAPLGAGSHPEAGQPVTIRFAGASYAGKLITKAGVE